ncbi:MAG: creatininase family protein [Polyangiaceae bacterium]|nr:creatininase family protein [Polyangiaceae bacterium]
MSTSGRRTTHLADLTSPEVSALLSGSSPVAALLPVGSVEPHGPHLPLATDTILSESAAEKAVPLLSEKGITALVVPSIPYGVTNFAEGFAGAVTLPAEALTSFLKTVIAAYLQAGFAHVCLVNNHLEPAHDAAVRASISTFPPGKTSVACPLTRRWGRTLSAEFKSGACHAGRYETSLVLAAAAHLVHATSAAVLPEVNVSLSDGIRAGKHTFIEMGMTHAYAGAPALATKEEGQDLYSALAAMVAGEVLDALRPAGEST